MKRLHPTQYAMSFLGFMTGLRPSSLRPLRRKGELADIKWEEGVLLVRRSQTEGEAMRRTKTKVKYRIELPENVIKVLRWHVATQIDSPAQEESDLLFPSVRGGFHARSVLDAPFEDCCAAMGLSKRITPRGMRRTYQDLMRAAGVRDVVTRSISGHATEQMQHHYSTVDGSEQKDAIGRVVSLASVRAAKAKARAAS